MTAPIVTVAIRMEPDVVLARQRARQLAALLGFDAQDQTRLATAVSEIARNAFQYAGSGRVEYMVDDGAPQQFLIRVSDCGPGVTDLERVLSGQYRSPTGMGLGITGARRLMDRFELRSSPGEGTMVLLGKTLPAALSPQKIRALGEELARQAPQSPFEEMQRQNQELLAALEEVRRRQEELGRLNRELEDTNRGVVALYAELDEQADSLRRASESKSRFLSNMSHEFRTPLNSILSLSRLLLDRVDGDLNAEQEKQVGFIRRSTEALSELVNDLLDLAKVEAGRVTVRAAEFQVADLFAALRGMLRPLLAHNTSVNLVFEEPEGLPALHTDEGKVSQILRNFVSNALKYTERGEVRVAAIMGSDDRILFSVADTGIGIPLEDQRRIFEEFTQLETPLQKRVKGTGLGLPLSRRLAELLGGSIYLESEPGIGSTFYAVLPIRYSGPAEASDVPEITTRVDPARMPVLVLEDDRETIFLYEKYLKGTGFQPIPARTLREARHLLQQVRPIAIVMDILLEAESTWDFLEQLKASATTRTLPVLVVTMVDNQHKALAMGADDFHAKPVEREWLHSRLKAIAGARRPKVLIIDDDEVSRYLLRNLLSERSCAIIEASGGREGLRLARQEAPRAVFLDLSMPDLSGFEVLEALRADPATREIPVVINTSHSLTEEERAQLAKHAVTILSKQETSRDSALTGVQDALAIAGL